MILLAGVHQEIKDSCQRCPDYQWLQNTREIGLLSHLYSGGSANSKDSHGHGRPLPRSKPGYKYILCVLLWWTFDFICVLNFFLFSYIYEKKKNYIKKYIYINNHPYIGFSPISKCTPTMPMRRDTLKWFHCHGEQGCSWRTPSIFSKNMIPTWTTVDQTDQAAWWRSITIY